MGKKCSRFRCFGNEFALDFHTCIFQKMNMFSTSNMKPAKTSIKHKEQQSKGSRAGASSQEQQSRISRARAAKQEQQSRGRRAGAAEQEQQSRTMVSDHPKGD